MMSDHSPSMGDEVFMTRKSESGKTKISIYAKRPKVDLAPFGNKLFIYYCSFLDQLVGTYWFSRVFLFEGYLLLH